MSELLRHVFKKRNSIFCCLTLFLLIFSSFFSSSSVFKRLGYDITEPRSDFNTNSQSFKSLIAAYSHDNDENENTTTNFELENEEEEDEDGDTISDETESVNKRELEIEVQESEAHIQSKLKNDTKRDEIELEFKIDDEISFDLRYKSETSAAELDLEFEIKFHSLVEYIDSDSDDKFDTDIDQIVQEIEFKSVDFLPIQYVNEQIQNVSLYSFSVITDDGLFFLRFYFLEEFTLINQSLITPTEIKMDIEINNFPYLQIDSRLALKIRLEAENEYEHDDETEDEQEGRSSNEEEVEVTINDFTGFFSWNEFVEVDGTNQTVVASSVETDEEDSNSQKIYLNYPQGSKIIHDPKLGVAGILRSPIIPTEIIENLLTILELSKEGYLLVVTVFTIIIIAGMVFYRKRYR